MIFSFQTSSLPHSFLPITLRLLGSNHLQEPIIRPKGIPFYQWFFCEKGIGEVILNQQKLCLSEGQGLFIYPGVPHSYHGLTSDWTLDFFGFDGPILADMLPLLHMQESGIYQFSDRTVFPAYIHRLTKLCGTPDRKVEQAFSKTCYCFLLDLYSCITYMSFTGTASDDHILHQISSFLEEHYAEDISLDMLSEQLCLTPEYLCTYYKKRMQCTIMYSLLILRISHARIFLRQYPERKVKEIARMCGFDSPSYFCRQFKKIVGVTPDQFRKGIHPAEPNCKYTSDNETGAGY